MAGVSQPLPLFEEQKLRQLVLPDLPGAARRPPRDRRRIALRDVGFPRGPGDVVVRLLDGHEQREVVQPARVRPAEMVEAIAQDGTAARVEAIEHSRPERPTVGDHGGKVDRPGGEELPAPACPSSASSPSSRSRSRLINSGFPANAEKHWYGESP